MSGINAHAIVGVVPSEPSKRRELRPFNSSYLWQWQRCWPMAIQNPLVSTFAHSEFECALSKCEHWYLFDHCVSGKALFPATGFLEMAHAVCGIVSSTGLSSLPPVLVQTTVHAPKILDSKDFASVICCTLHHETLTIHTGNGNKAIQHVTTTAGCLASVDGSPTQQSDRLPRALLSFTRQRAAAQLQIASISNDGPAFLETQSYGVHPAVGDAALHLGAVKSPPASSSIAGTEIPTGFQASVQQREVHGHRTHTQGSEMYWAASLSASDAHLGASHLRQVWQESPCYASHVSGIKTKSTRLKLGKKSDPAVAADFAYVWDEQAVTVQSPRSRSSCFLACAHLDLEGTGLSINNSYSDANFASNALTALHAPASGGVGSVACRSAAGPCPGDGPIRAGAVFTTLLKVASAERGNQAWGNIYYDVHSRDQTTTKGVPINTTASGRVVRTRKLLQDLTPYVSCLPTNANGYMLILIYV